ncbi:MAG TPA: diadenylate cyclase [Planctomycetota bacterium]|nr:diadenylate cyclase [Planctomycetota bacterium]
MPPAPPSPPVLTPAVVTVLFLAVVLYGLARVLAGTVFGGIVRGLSLALGVLCATAILSGVLLRSEHALKVVDILLPAITICLVVLFQPEIRRALLRLKGPLEGPAQGEKPAAPDEVVRAVERLSRERWGALIAWERRVGLGEVVATGVPLDAEIRAETIVNVFAPDTPLHDGALVIRGTRLAAAGCVLPVGEGAVPPEGALRHRAALGLAEQTDALVVIVSEETGKVALAHDGRVDTLEGIDSLRRVLAAGPGTAK